MTYTKEDVDKMGPCYGCLMGAMRKASFSGSWSTAEAMSNAVVFTDSWGPAKTAAIGGYRYVRIFVTRRSKFTFSYLMRLEKDLIKATERFLQDYQGGDSHPQSFADEGHQRVGAHECLPDGDWQGARPE